MPFHRSSKVSALAMTVIAIIASVIVATCMVNPSLTAGLDKNSRGNIAAEITSGWAIDRAIMVYGRMGNPSLYIAF
jgi:hypothetical protein